MSLFSFIGEIFKPAADLVDDLHTSDEERGNIEIKKSELKNKLAEIEAKVSTKMLDLQSKSLEAQTKMAVAEQQHGNWLSKSWRPICSIACMTILISMGYGLTFRDPILMQICGGFLGIYGFGRSYEKSKRN